MLEVLLVTLCKLKNVSRYYLQIGCLWHTLYLMCKYKKFKITNSSILMCHIYVYCFGIYIFSWLILQFSFTTCRSLNGVLEIMFMVMSVSSLATPGTLD